MTDRPAPQPPPAPFDARPPRRRQLLALVTGLVFVLAGIVLATGPLLPAVVGVLSILFFGPVVLFQLVMLLGGRPRVLVDDAGVTDHASPAGFGLLGWDRIRGARVERLDERTRLVVVEVEDPDELVQRSGRLWRRTRRMSRERYGSPVVIPVRGLGVRSDVLCRAITDRVRPV